MIHSERLTEILSMLQDPLFIDFEREQGAPSIFNAVGRTHTETWHSALLGWLFDPAGSHGLKSFPVERLILLLNTQDTLPVDQRGLNFKQLLISGDFTKARVRPNERELSEVSVPGVGRFDVFVDGIQCKPWHEVRLLIEVKVKDRINPQQCQKYIAHITELKRQNVFTLPIFIAPASRLAGRPEQLFGDASWMSVDFQTLVDEIIEACLLHPVLTDFGRYTLQEYIKTLKYRLQGGEPLATTQQERDAVRVLFEKHESAIKALFEILSASDEQFAPIGEETKRRVLRVKFDGMEFSAKSVKELYLKLLKHLDEHGKLAHLELPIKMGPKRYLLANDPKDQSGDDFRNPVEYKGVYMEANRSHGGALQAVARLAELCGVAFEVVNKDEQGIS